MAGPANLKVNIIANAKGLSKTYKEAEKKTKNLGKGLKTAFAAIGTAAVVGFGLVVASIRAAIEEQKSVKLLDDAILRLKGTTQAQADAVEVWIDKIKRASTFTDDDLRPALGRLINATGRLTTAQRLLGTAQDLAVASGKPLETVTIAVSKAVNGNKTSLLKLFPELVKVNDKTKTGADLVKILGDKYKGADKSASDTAAGGLKKLSETFTDIEETLGQKFLPYLEDFSTWAQSKDGQETIDNITAAVVALADAFIKVTGGIDETIIGFRSIGAFFSSKEFQDVLNFGQYLGLGPPPGGSVQSNAPSFGDLLDNIVNGPAPKPPGNFHADTYQRPAGGRQATQSVTINVQTLDPAAAGIAVRRALNTDAIRQGTLRLGP